MDNQILKTDSQATSLTKTQNEVSQIAWQNLPVKADSPLDEVLRLGTPQISSLNAGTGSTEVGELIFETMILSVLEFYGAQWRKEQSSEVAQMIHRDYYWLHLAELKSFALKAKKGIYNVKETFAKPQMPMDADGNRAPYQGTEEYDGKIYGQLNPAVFMKWIERFANESLATRGAMQIERDVVKELPEHVEYVDPEKLSSAMQDFIKQWSRPGDTVDAAKEKDYQEIRERVRRERIEQVANEKPVGHEA